MEGYRLTVLFAGGPRSFLKGDLSSFHLPEAQLPIDTPFEHEGQTHFPKPSWWKESSLGQSDLLQVRDQLGRMSKKLIDLFQNILLFWFWAGSLHWAHIDPNQIGTHVDIYPRCSSNPSSMTLLPSQHTPSRWITFLISPSYSKPHPASTTTSPCSSFHFVVQTTLRSSSSDFLFFPWKCTCSVFHFLGSRMTAWAEKLVDTNRWELNVCLICT